MPVFITFEKMLAKRLKFMDDMMRKSELKKQVAEALRKEALNHIIEKNLAEKLKLYQSLEGKACYYCGDPTYDVKSAVAMGYQDGAPRAHKPICYGCSSWILPIRK